MILSRVVINVYVECENFQLLRVVEVLPVKRNQVEVNLELGVNLLLEALDGRKSLNQILLELISVTTKII